MRHGSGIRTTDDVTELDEDESLRGDTIQVYYGGSAAGASVGGVYLDGTYTPGDQIASFTVSNVVTQVGSSDR